MKGAMARFASAGGAALALPLLVIAIAVPSASVAGAASRNGDRRAWWCRPPGAGGHHPGHRPHDVHLPQRRLVRGAGVLHGCRADPGRRERRTPRALQRDHLVDHDGADAHRGQRLLLHRRVLHGPMFCAAVGVQFPAGFQQNFAEVWNGTTWALTTTPDRSALGDGFSAASPV